MIDLAIRGATLVDGTGTSARLADVGIDGGRVVAVGEVTDTATRTVDATGRVVCPGFVDIHTHYDVQALWDPACTPSPLHGVTTVIGGNCGFSIAPLEPEHVDYVMRLMARVEGMPLDALLAGPAWDWRGFGEFLDRLDGRLAVNAGFLAGHSTIRRLVMGDRATTAAATADEISAMSRLLAESLAGGALGFSSSLGEAHTDGDGNPVPSRTAAHDEIVALARVAGDHPGTTLEFIAAMGEIPADRIELMADMSLAANRPLNWNLLGSLSPTEVYEQQLTSCDRAAERGATVVALALPDLLRMRSTQMLGALPGWGEVLAAPAGTERRRLLGDPGTRARLRAGLDEAATRGLSVLQQWELVEIAESPIEGLAGRTVAAVAAERGIDPADALLDLVVADGAALAIVFPSLVPSLGVSPASWATRGAVWNDPRVMLGGSDSGAHLDLMCHANYTTVVLGEMTRDRGLFTLEHAVRHLTDAPARLLGLRDRGRIEVGAHADVVVFDPATVGSRPAEARHDLPGGAMRLYAEATGIDQVIVAGQTIVEHGTFTGARPGVALRSGRDTDTVTVPGRGRTR